MPAHLPMLPISCPWTPVEDLIGHALFGRIFHKFYWRMAVLPRKSSLFWPIESGISSNNENSSPIQKEILWVLGINNKANRSIQTEEDQ